MMDSSTPSLEPEPITEPTSKINAKRVITPEEQQRRALLPPTPPPTEGKEEEKVDSYSLQTEEANVKAALSVLRAYRDSVSASATIFNLEPINLTPTAYQSFLYQLHSDHALWSYVEDKIQYDYNPMKSLLTVRMPSLVHECTVESVRDYITQELKSLGKGPGKGAELARKIHSRGSATILFKKSSAEELYGGRKDPDVQFGYEGASYPGMILEVVYTSGRPLEEAADFYIGGSDGAIRAVLGIDIAYNAECASVSLWRTCDLDGDQLLVDPILENQMLLDESGEEVDNLNNQDVQIPLSLFAPDAPEMNYLGEPEPSVRIPLKFLAEAVKNAKQAGTKSEMKGVSQLVRTKTIVKRKRKTSEVQGESQEESEQDTSSRAKVPRTGTKARLDERE